MVPLLIYGLAVIVAYGDCLPVKTTVDVLPKITSFHSSTLEPGRQAQVAVTLQSATPIELVWRQKISTNNEYFSVPVTNDQHHKITTRLTGSIYESKLDITNVSKTSYSLRIITKKSLTLELFIPMSGLNGTGITLPTITTLPNALTKIRANDRGSIRLDMELPSNSRVLHVMEWTPLTESSIAFKRVKYVFDKSLPGSASSTARIGNHSVQSELSFETFSPKDAGLYGTIVWVTLPNNIVVATEIYSEVSYQPFNQILIGVETCSGYDSMPMDSTGEVELLVRPGHDCLRCVAVGHPRPKLQITKFISLSNVTTVTTMPHFEAGESYTAVSHTLVSREDAQPESYFCLGSQIKPWPQVNIIPVKITVFKPVKMTKVTPQKIVISGPKSVTFKCEATGSPVPEINFYRAPSWMKMHDLTQDPENDLYWRRMPERGNVEVTRTVDDATETITAAMTIRKATELDAGNNFVYKCLARNKRSFGVGTMDLEYKTNVRS